MTGRKEHCSKMNEKFRKDRWNLRFKKENMYNFFLIRLFFIFIQLYQSECKQSNGRAIKERREKGNSWNVGWFFFSAKILLNSHLYEKLPFFSVLPKEKGWDKISRIFFLLLVTIIGKIYRATLCGKSISMADHGPNSCTVRTTFFFSLLNSFTNEYVFAPIFTLAFFLCDPHNELTDAIIINGFKCERRGKKERTKRGASETKQNKTNLSHNNI